jgi:hypothetical protein
MQLQAAELQARVLLTTVLVHLNASNKSHVMALAGVLPLLAVQPGVDGSAGGSS